MSAASLPATPQINHITGRIITAAMKVHTELGPGLLESAYHTCLLHELRKQGLRVASQVGLPVVYDGEKIDLGYRIDLIVCDAVIVEIKCVEAINPIHQAQLLSYLRLSDLTGVKARQELCDASVWPLCSSVVVRLFAYKISHDSSCICGNFPYI